MFFWVFLYLLFGTVIWFYFTPDANKLPEWYFIPFRIMLWPVIAMMAMAAAITIAARDFSAHSKVTRIEVIDEDGRVYGRWGVKLDLHYQDEGRTLKVFVEKRKDARR
jgi:hypothetical protein